MKWCARCEKDLPTSAFSPDRSHSDGLTTYCKKCRATAKRTDRRKRPEIARLRDKADYAARLARAQAQRLSESPEPLMTMKRCSQCGQDKPVAAFSLHWGMLDGRQTTCKDCQQSARAAKYLDDTYRLSENARCRDYYYANLDQEYRRRQAYYLAHREARSAGGRAWRLAHPEEIRLYASRRRARQLGLPDTLTSSDIHFLHIYWAFACAVCGREEGLFGWRLALDHWIPLASPACPGTVATNMIPLCHGIGGCNNSKHGSDPLPWLIRRFGVRKARHILRKVDAYFAIVRSQTEAERSA